MTAIDRIDSRTPIPYGQIRRRVTGTAEEVAATVALVLQSGRLLTVTTPRQLDPSDPRVTVIVTLRDQPAVRVTRLRVRRRWVKPVAIAGTATTVLGGAGYGLLLLTQAASRAVAAPATLGALFLIVLVVALVRWVNRPSGCSGLHCSGCGRH